MRADYNVTYTVDVRIGGFSLALMNIFGGGRSVHETLFGTGEWAPLPQLAASDGEGTSPFREVLLAAKKSHESDNLAPFYSTFSEKVLVTLDPEEAARLIFSDLGLIEAWEQNWLELSSPLRADILSAAVKIQIPPSTSLTLRQIETHPFVDVEAIKRVSQK